MKTETAKTCARNMKCILKEIISQQAVHSCKWSYYIDCLNFFSEQQFIFWHHLYTVSQTVRQSELTSNFAFLRGMFG